MLDEKGLDNSIHDFHEICESIIASFHGTCEEMRADGHYLIKGICPYCFPIRDAWVVHSPRLDEKVRMSREHYCEHFVGALDGDSVEEGLEEPEHDTKTEMAGDYSGGVYFYWRAGGDVSH